MTFEEAAEKLGTDVAGVRALVAGGRLRREGEGVDPMSVLQVMTSQLSDLSLKMSARDERPLVVAVVVPVALVLFVLFYFVFLFSAADANPIVPPLAMVPITAGWLGATGALARWGGGLGTTNGMGVALYGRRETSTGVVGTAWLTALFVPLVPLRSYRVLQEVAHDRTLQGAATSYRLADAPLCWPQVLPILAGVWGFVAVANLWVVYG